MLQRLNAAGGGDNVDVPGRVADIPDGFVRAVDDELLGGRAEGDVSVEEVGEKERKRLRKEQRRKEKAAAEAKADIAHDGVPSEGELPSVPVDAGLTVPPLQPAAPTKLPRRMA
jgi:hypothetical protein